jgi:hypothetical protein
MESKQWLVGLSVLAFYIAPLGAAQDSAEIIERLKQQNNELAERVKSLETDFNAKVKALQEEFDQKIKVLERKTELDTEAAAAKFAEAEKTKSLFKIPEWVTSIKLNNDLRMRYDGIFAPDSEFVTRNRLRPRLRLGGIATLKDDWEIGFRLASSPSIGGDSGGDPLSTNATFENNGSRKPVGVDWAFARWTPIKSPDWTTSFSLGKLENPPNFTEDVFDVDYTPEGFAQQFAWTANANHTVSTYFGQYFLDEVAASGKDPFLLLEQLRLDSTWDRNISTSFGVAGLSIANPQSLTTTSVPDSNHGNTRTPLVSTNGATSGGTLVNDYQLLIADGSLTYNLDSFPLYKGPFPIKFFGEFIHNFGAPDNNIGFSLGPSFGRVSQTGKVQKGNWEVSYRYQELQGDMNYEELTASDNGTFYRSRPTGEPGNYSFRPAFFSGLNLRGHAFRIAYAPFDSLVVDARVWLNEAIRVSAPGEDVEGVRALVDLVWKF